MTAAMLGLRHCDLLFVYGTLRHGFPLHRHLERLGATFQTEGKIAAELFDLGPYPGARPATAEGRWVRGELFKLRRPAQDLKALDGVEGFTAATPERCEFVRALAEVALAGNSRVSAWVYWLQERASLGRPIASGDYAKRRMN